MGLQTSKEGGELGPAGVRGLGGQVTGRTLWADAASRGSMERMHLREELLDWGPGARIVRFPPTALPRPTSTGRTPGSASPRHRASPGRHPERWAPGARAGPPGDPRSPSARASHRMAGLRRRYRPPGASGYPSQGRPAAAVRAGHSHWPRRDPSLNRPPARTPRPRSRRRTRRPVAHPGAS